MTKLSKSHTANELFEVLIAPDHVMETQLPLTHSGNITRYTSVYMYMRYNSLFHEGGNERVNPSNSVVKMALRMQMDSLATADDDAVNEIWMKRKNWRGKSAFSAESSSS